MTDQQKLEKFLQNEIGKPRPCALCKQPATVTGVFFFNKIFARKIGRTKDGAVAYGLCSDCMKIPDKVSRVEATLIESHVLTALARAKGKGNA
jgi:hypothetical protein